MAVHGHERVGVPGRAESPIMSHSRQRASNELQVADQTKASRIELQLLEHAHQRLAGPELLLVERAVVIRIGCLEALGRNGLIFGLPFSAGCRRISYFEIT
jgi:hypothetical protein